MNVHRISSFPLIIRADVFTGFTLVLISLFLLLTGDIANGQSAHDHHHDQGSSHSHSHNEDNATSHTGGQNHTHRPVDYSFNSDSIQYDTPVADDEGYYWWKGNLHTHTLWSDGDQFPEVVSQWYYKNGYNFLSISDHNVVLRGENWINLETNPNAQSGGGMDIYDVYREKFGDDWIETREVDGELEVRLKPLSEVSPLFEEAGRFLMINAEEITEPEHTIHVNATNILDLIEPEAGETVEETIRLNIDAVVEQREQTGQDMIAHLNHPNFRKVVTAEDMFPVENLRLFEIYNGHRGVLNFGEEDGTKDLDRVWDIILTKRLGELDLNPVYGVAVDDGHHYEGSASHTARPGRGWVKVRTRYLTPEHIVRALESGNFYGSTGVDIADVSSDGKKYSVTIEPEDGVGYMIRFIGTREGYDPSSEPYIDEDGQVRDDRTRLYSNEVGETLKEINGNKATYEFEGDELYVRVKIISTKLKENYFIEGEVEKAWLQPLIPGQEY
ncbi:MAG: hypothetical protein WD038_04715 [Balneolales bacterium]